jgi:hypothetical protein
VIGAYLTSDHFFTPGQMWLLDLGASSEIARPYEKGGTAQ